MTACHERSGEFGMRQAIRRERIKEGALQLVL